MEKNVVSVRFPSSTCDMNATNTQLDRSPQAAEHPAPERQSIAPQVDVLRMLEIYILRPYRQPHGPVLMILCDLREPIQFIYTMKPWPDAELRSPLLLGDGEQLNQDSLPNLSETGLPEQYQKSAEGIISYKDVSHLSYQDEHPTERSTSEQNRSTEISSSLGDIREVAKAVGSVEIVSTKDAAGYISTTEETMRSSTPSEIAYGGKYIVSELSSTQVKTSSTSSAVSSGTRATELASHQLLEEEQSYILSRRVGSHACTATSPSGLSVLPSDCLGRVGLRDVTDEIKELDGRIMEVEAWTGTSEDEEEVDDYWTWDIETQKFFHVDEHTGKTVYHPDEFD
ncbi:hypothetical protein F4677DRAFT_172206 [Hypoxylon crocopeplum]|nr:hypothetical protein F4677DRAFT_172206 [Hypoxylon crocopeplum]